MYTDINDTISIDPNLCIACDLCKDVCPVDAIKVKTSWLDVGGGTGSVSSGTFIKLIIDPDECISVGLCATVCPTFAIRGVYDIPVGDNGSGNGSGADGSDTDTTSNPCEEAKPAASIATAFANQNIFKDILPQVRINDGIEHGVVFGSVNGVVLSTAVQNGGPSSSNFQHTFASPIASLHYHPNSFPPSVGDVYSLISSYNGHNTFSTFYISTPNGNLYALVVTDPNAMNNFLSNFPASIFTDGDGTHINFPQPLGDQYNDIAFDADLGNQQSYEIAMAYMLDKFNIGMALTKMSENGNFDILGADNTTNSNGGSYSQTKCP